MTQKMADEDFAQLSTGMLTMRLQWIDGRMGEIIQEFDHEDDIGKRRLLDEMEELWKSVASMKNDAREKIDEAEKLGYGLSIEALEAMITNDLTPFERRIRKIYADNAASMR